MGALKARQTDTFTLQQASLLRMALTGTLLLTVLALYQFWAYSSAEELLVTSGRIRLVLYLGYTGAFALLLLVASSWMRFVWTMLDWLARVKSWLARLGVFPLVLFLVVLPLFPWLVMGSYGQFLVATFPRLLAFWALVALGAALLSGWRNASWLTMLPASALTFGFVYRLALFIPEVSAYPFSLGWSEISRYYQASFFFGQQIYGVKLAWPVTHPSRYVLQAIPFLFTNSPLWLHRLWQVFLWIGLTGGTAWVLARRLKVQGRGARWLFVAWTFLYLFQGAVFYHLLVCVIIVVLGFDRDKFWRSVVVVALASVWAGISRINWAPMPGLIAATLYFLETPTRAPQKRLVPWRYLLQPLAYFLAGSLVALGSYAVYIRFSGVQDPSQFGSAFFSDLLWDRLLPNAEFGPGILLGILLVSAPLLIVIVRRLRRAAWHPIRLLALGAILLVLFLGGLVVSVKIGGGTNLHNMDAYMVILLLVAAYLYFGRAADETTDRTFGFASPHWLVAGLVIVPLLFTLTSGGPYTPPDPVEAQAALIDLQALADQARADGQDVLLISQRHLLTFHLLEGVPLVHDYEKLFLMEMAISRNGAYLSRFHEDIQNQRFSLIVTDPLYTQKKEDSEDSLAAENNAWVVQVSRPILCYYEPLQWFTDKYPDLSIEVLVPLDTPKCTLD